MSVFQKSSLAAAVLFAAVSFSAPTHSAVSGADPQVAFDLANSICSSGNVAGSLAGSPAGPMLKAIALGEAARQAGVGQCKATPDAINAALQALIASAGGDAKLQTAFDAQKNSGSGSAGNGIKGFGPGSTKLASTITSTSAGEKVSGD